VFSDKVVLTIGLTCLLNVNTNLEGYSGSFALTSDAARFHFGHSRPLEKVVFVAFMHLETNRAALINQ